MSQRASTKSFLFLAGVSTYCLVVFISYVTCPCLLLQGVLIILAGYGIVGAYHFYPGSEGNAERMFNMALLILRTISFPMFITHIWRELRMSEDPINWIFLIEGVLLFLGQMLTEACSEFIDGAIMVYVAAGAVAAVITDEITILLGIVLFVGAYYNLLRTHRSLDVANYYFTAFTVSILLSALLRFFATKTTNFPQT